MAKWSIGALRRLENRYFRSPWEATRIESWEQPAGELFVFFYFFFFFFSSFFFFELPSLSFSFILLLFRAIKFPESIYLAILGERFETLINLVILAFALRKRSLRLARVMSS